MSNDTNVYPSAFDTEKYFLPAFNNLKTTLATYVAPGQFNIINVNSTGGFPDEGIISIDKEVIYYKSKTATSFKNIVRGYDGTISMQHASGADVELRWVAAHHNRVKNAVKSIERTLGINPQGSYPDVASRLAAFFSSVFRRTSQVFYQNDGATKSETGYMDGARTARMFIAPERFVKVPKFGPIAYIDGIAQIQNDPVLLNDNIPITQLQVNDGSGKGIITCSTGTFVGDGIQPGDLVVVKGTPTNNDAYIVDSVLSNTQIKVTEIIFGVDQLIGAVGSISVVDANDINSPLKDIISIPISFTSSDEADAVIFINPPDTIQQVRFDYDIKNSGAVVTYSDPIAIVADYQNPTNSGTIPINGSDVFTLNIGRTRALIFKVRLTSNTAPQSTNVRIELFGKADLTDLQYTAEYIDLTLGDFIDRGVWHYTNNEATPLNTLYVRITDLGSQGFDYTFDIEAEALGTND